jgi:CRP/FNR family transcriptional regulator, cyclic AMP receptor protein
MQPFRILAMLYDHPLFANLPSASIERLITYLTKRWVARGTTIFRKGDAGNELIVVLSGSVRISAPGVDGREAVLNRIHEGQIFGEIAMLDGRPRTADAVAASDCELLVINRREFSSLLWEHPPLYFPVMEILCGRLRQTSEHLEDVILLDLPTRLAKVILKLAGEFDGAWPRRLSVTQREVSHHVGASREHTNKQLRLWAKAGFIRLERAAIVVLMPEALAEIAGTR